MHCLRCLLTPYLSLQAPMPQLPDLPPDLPPPTSRELGALAAAQYQALHGSGGFPHEAPLSSPGPPPNPFLQEAQRDFSRDSPPVPGEQDAPMCLKGSSVCIREASSHVDPAEGAARLQPPQPSRARCLTEPAHLTARSEQLASHWQATDRCSSMHSLHKAPLSALGCQQIPSRRKADVVLLCRPAPAEWDHAPAAHLDRPPAIMDLSHGQQQHHARAP